MLMTTTPGNGRSNPFGNGRGGTTGVVMSDTNLIKNPMGSAGSKSKVRDFLAQPGAQRTKTNGPSTRDSGGAGAPAKVPSPAPTRKEQTASTGRRSFSLK
jgi:hypothetical protein